MTPAWLLDLVAALMLTVAAVSAGRLAAARPWRNGAVVVDTDVAHLLMAIAMAGMLSTALTTAPDTAWEFIFGLLTAWFAVRVLLDTRASGIRALAGGHCAPHLAHSAAMLYMFLTLTAPAAGTGAMAGMPGMAGGSAAMMTLHVPTLAFAFTLVLAGYSIWDLDQLSARRSGLTAVALPLGARPAAVSATALTTGPAATPATVSAAQVPATAMPATAVSRPASPGFGAGLLAPAVTVGCRITMGLAMVFLLVITL
jgi:hypothetical protein